MKVKKKITKKKLREPDQFINFSERAFLYITRHLRKIATGALIVLILLLVIYIYQKWDQGKEAKAYQEFSLAAESYQMSSSPYRDTTPAEDKKILEKFEDVIQKFPRTSSGILSLLYKGNLHLRMEEFEEAIKAYEIFLQKMGKERLYRLFALEGLGYALEGKKDFEKALDAYQKIIDTGESFQTAGAYLNKGRCYEKLGKTKEALESYRTFLKLSGKSVLTNSILRKISLLESN